MVKFRNSSQSWAISRWTLAALQGLTAGTNGLTNWRQVVADNGFGIPSNETGEPAGHLQLGQSVCVCRPEAS